jgi:integrase
MDNLTSLDSTFRAWLQVHGKKCQGHAEKSIASAISDLHVLIRFFEKFTGESFSPDKVISRDLRAFENASNFGYDGDAPVAPATWNRRFNSLKLFFECMMDEGVISSNVFEMAGLRERRKQEESPRSLSRPDYARVCRAVEQTVNMAHTDTQRRLAIRDRAMFALMANAALRVGELCALRRSHLLLSDRKGVVKVWHGKGDKDGEVCLSREARYMVSDWLKINDQDLLFDGITERQVQRYCEKISKLSGVKFTPHVLRHTAIRNVWISTDGDQAITKTFARHSNVQQTLRYAMPHQEDMQRAVENL